MKRAFVTQVTLRLVAGLNYQEIADELQRERPVLKNLPLPAVVSKAWVAQKQRRLREAVTKTLDAD